MKKRKHSVPVRSLLLYGDGRVFELNEPCYGVKLYVTEKRDSGFYDRVFEHQIAVDAQDNFCSVFVESEGKESTVAPTRIDDLGSRILISVDTPKPPKDARGWHRDCLKNGGHRFGDGDSCQACGLSGHVVRTMTYLDARDEKERQEVSTLRDQLVKQRDEITALKVENSDLRRSLEKSSR